jgi:hypothetical protein
MTVFVVVLRVFGKHSDICAVFDSAEKAGQYIVNNYKIAAQSGGDFEVIEKIVQ